MKSSVLQFDGNPILSRCWIAQSFLSRFLGLVTRSGLSDNEAMFFPRCNSIHTFFMRFAIDVVFISVTGEVIEIVTALRPWRLVLPKRGARHVLELGARRSQVFGLRQGSRVHMEGFFHEN